MSKNNEFDGLNYQNPKYSPVQDFAKWYEQNGKSKVNDQPASDSVEALQKRFAEDPESLSPVERLSLGFANLNAKNEAEAKERQAKANEFRQEYEQQRKEDKEFISTRSEEYQKLARDMAEMQSEFQKLNGEGGE